MFSLWHLERVRFYSIQYTIYHNSTQPLSRLAMVICTCPIRCKGGRDVAKKTRSKHERELRDQEDLRILQERFPGRFTSLPDAPRTRRRRADDDGGAQRPLSKRVRGNHQQGNGAETQPVRGLAK